MNIQGRPIPRSTVEMERELEYIRSKKADSVIIGKPKNEHELAPFIQFLTSHGITVILDS